jgi:hypothetical protein
MQTGEGLQPDEEVIEHRRVGVHTAKEETDLAVTRVHLLQTRLQLVEFGTVQLADGLGEVPQIGGSLVELTLDLFVATVCLEITDHPGHHRVLRQIVKTATGILVDQAQVLKITQFPSTPLLSKLPLLKGIGPIIDNFDLTVPQIVQEINQQMPFKHIEEVGAMFTEIGDLKSSMSHNIPPRKDPRAFEGDLQTPELLLFPLQQRLDPVTLGRHLVHPLLRQAQVAHKRELHDALSSR